MVSPAVSSWVFYGDRESASNCARLCARICASYAAGNASFRSALFSNLSD